MLTQETLYLPFTLDAGFVTLYSPHFGFDLGHFVDGVRGTSGTINCFLSVLWHACICMHAYAYAYACMLCICICMHACMLCINIQ